MLILAAVLLIVQPAHAQTENSTLAEGFQLMRAGNCAPLPELLGPLLAAKGPNQEPAYRLVSDCYIRTGQTQQAITVLREGLQRIPDSPLLERSLGEALLRDHPDSTEVGQLLEKAASALPGDPESHHFYAQWAYLNNREPVCIAEEKRALNLSGLNDTARLQMHTLKGLCEDRLNQTQAAQADFEQSNRLNENSSSFDPATAFQYADFLTRRNQDAKAQQILDEIIRKSPQYGPAHLSKAKYLDRKGERDKAIVQAEQALAGQGSDADGIRAAHVLLARLYFAAGRTAQAEREQQWVIAHSGNQ
ncbi:MAG TPA: hypothetical protein VKX25_09270 [Bryobacteraceae bacterium]|nr:hypothetical protein [Bryobacteraceae bacterium]